MAGAGSPNGDRSRWLAWAGRSVGTDSSKGEEVPAPPALIDTDVARNQFDAVTQHLRRSRTHQRWAAFVLGAIAVIAAAAGLVYLLPHATKTALDAIEGAALSKNGRHENPNSNYAILVTIYEVIRTAGYAALTAGLIYGLFNMARAAMDQATRFDKRLIAAQYLNYVLHAPTGSREQLEDALKVLKAFTENVESAYSHVKIPKKGSGGPDVSLEFGKDGGRYEEKHA